jgi:hypothetical protein
VANQVIQSSPVARVVNGMTPQAILEEKITTQKVKVALEQEYASNREFRKYVDTQTRNLDQISDKFRRDVLSGFGEMSSYETSLSDVIGYVGLPGVSPVSLVRSLESQVPDLGLFVRLASSIPSRKPDKLPAGSRITLSDSVNLDQDYRGVGFSTGYLTPRDYFQGVAFPGAGKTADNLPDSIIKSIREGYNGYATLRPLDSLLRPGLSSLISLDDIRDSKNVSRSVAGLGTVGAIRDLTGIGALSRSDQAMYDVDLSSLIVDINGYTTYRAEINSNGDYIDTSLIPDYEAENSDPGFGLPYSQRTRSATF